MPESAQGSRGARGDRTEEPGETAQRRQAFRRHKTHKPLLGRQTRGGHSRLREQHLQRPRGLAEQGV